MEHETEPTLEEITRMVRHSIASYAEAVQTEPATTVGRPWGIEKIRRGIAEMELALVSPYWTEAEIRDTFEDIGTLQAPPRRCVVVANDNEETIFLFDPLANDFVLAQRCNSGLVTFGVRGDPVGCFLAR